MKRVLSIVMAVAVICGALTCFASCGKQSDWEKIQEQGYFRVGYTNYNPMNYVDETDELVGFDTEFAKLVAKELGVEVKFQLITWSQKYSELSSGAIDCIWNGFTSNCADDDGVQRSEKVDFSTAYMDNAQCVVVNSAKLSEFTSAESLKGKVCAVEGGSAGASYAVTVTTDDEAHIKKVDSQIDAFTELKSGAVDFIVVDVLLANEMCGKGEYESLAKVTAIEIATEEYSIGFRKGSDFTAKVNEVIEKLAKNGELKKLADKYGLNLTEALANLK
ncbi:MAG: transporter substrate-binding domain-containing protein [Clostridia bacterium]|nr:transporter substrate-binding domain-containing protein [Clostridia bacterium]